MKHTGVFATEEEIQALSVLYQRASQSPVTVLSSADGRKYNMQSGEAWDYLMRKIHKYARAHGLPEIPGGYGMDSETREFLEA